MNSVWAAGSFRLLEQFGRTARLELQQKGHEWSQACCDDRIPSFKNMAGRQGFAEKVSVDLMREMPLSGTMQLSMKNRLGIAMISENNVENSAHTQEIGKDLYDVLAGCLQSLL